MPLAIMLCFKQALQQMRSYKMDKITITSAQYVSGKDNHNSEIIVEIDSQQMNVPLDPANRHYAEILRQVAAGELTVQEAD